LQAFNRIEQTIEVAVAGAARHQQALPVGEEAGQRVLLDGLHFAAQLGERFAADEAQHLGIAPLAMEAAGRNPPSSTRPSASKLAQGGFDGSGIESKALRSGARNVNGPWVRA
jgi:hypothetical protein